MTTPRFAQIELDAKKCTTPFDCKACLEVCPQSVFMVTAVKVEKGRETDPKEPGTYFLLTGHRDKCTGCNDCIEICPVDAITITWPPLNA
ncbi:MAG: 4Fe-4S dicluster domain-containing protein [Candidatus Adiutricales bacterium]